MALQVKEDKRKADTDIDFEFQTEIKFVDCILNPSKVPWRKGEKAYESK